MTNPYPNEGKGKPPVLLMDPRQFQNLGYLQEVNRNFLHPLGLALAVQTYDDGSTGFTVWDCRDEGICFAWDGDPEEAWGKAEAVRMEHELRSVPRIMALGYLIQPLPGEQVGLGDSGNVNPLLLPAAAGTVVPVDELDRLAASGEGQAPNEVLW